MTYEELHKELDAEFEPLVDKALEMEDKGVGYFYAMFLLHQWGEEKRLLTHNRKRVRFGPIPLPDCCDDADEFTPAQEGA